MIHLNPFRRGLGVACFALALFPHGVRGQITANPPDAPAATPDNSPASPPSPASSGAANPAKESSPASTPSLSQRERAEQQLREEEKQRILGVVPNFNTSYVPDAVALSPRQKFSLAFRSSVDPFIFVAAAGDAGISQAENEYPGYSQGAAGYGKRLGASYLDDFDGTMIGNALFPVLLRQDPRYFRLGKGSFTRRTLYSISTTVWCKNDNQKWGPNYSNVLGNFAAGGISNLYYPSSDRGVGLTFERGLTVTAEGTIGALFDEFWPDIAHRIMKGRFAKLQGNIPPATPAVPPPDH